MKTLLIIPAYNEARNIAGVARSVAEAGYDFIVVNDGSTDSTLKVCRENSLPVLDLKHNLGIGGAVQAGHKYALEHGYDADVQFDGDGQHDVNYVAPLLELLEKGADLAIGSRFCGDSDGFKSSAMRRIGIRWLAGCIKLFAGKRVTDPTSGFRACNRRAIELFCRNYPTDYPEPESIVTALKNGLEVQEASVIMHERAGGASSIRALSSVYYMIKVSLAIAIMSFSRSRRAS
ncbi:glycosyl transferase family 2 [Gordonibacter urolithinfaciens]|nr:glycosyl transferase family 2 [Gordonibacter urolithinfaciens]